VRSETEEWLDELVRSWTEVYKKSVTTLVLMRSVAELAPASASVVGARFTRETGWQLTEQALYRSLRRLTASRLLRVEEVPVARTGARRKDYSPTNLGRAYLARIEDVVASSSPRDPTQPISKTSRAGTRPASTSPKQSLTSSR
jgi:DNA-binding PadR family transcriptional regulator